MVRASVAPDGPVHQALTFLEGIPDGPVLQRSLFKSMMRAYGYIMEARRRPRPAFVAESLPASMEDLAPRTARAIETWGKQLRMLKRADSPCDAARTARAVLRVVVTAAKYAHACMAAGAASSSAPEDAWAAAMATMEAHYIDLSRLTHAQYGALLQELHPTCARCGLSEFEPALDKLRWCGRCYAARYCCRDCQLADWPRHRAACRQEASAPV